MPTGAPVAALPKDVYRYVDPEASLAPWYLVGKERKLVKKEATAILRKGRIGEFFVRDISSHPGCLGLSIKTSKDDLMNYLLQPQAGGTGISVRGTKEVFLTLSKLITHYSSKRRPSLPVRLIEPGDRRTLKGKKGKTMTHKARRQDTHPAVINGGTTDEEEFEGFGTDFYANESAQPSATGAAKRAPRSDARGARGAAKRPSRVAAEATFGASGGVRRPKQPAEDPRVTASRVTEAINSSVQEVVGAHLEDFTQERIDNMERRIAKRRAMIEKRRLALLQERGAESKKTLDSLEQVFSGDVASAATAPPPAPLGGRLSKMSLDALERARGSRTGSPPPAVQDAESVIADPVAMWDAIVKSEATSSVKLNAAKKQLLYIQQEERLIQEKLAQAEAALRRPRHFSEDDTVFDDNFENGTIIDDTGEVFGFGGL
mmetsp:Transcript_8709/g.26192  ORF Transcript_8709/g.26192 Transcript_8709/m.26192 type:complete len:432 (+) Transcript_8709:189-1484(+)